jgi:hypothetical protein
MWKTTILIGAVLAVAGGCGDSSNGSNGGDDDAGSGGVGGSSGIGGGAGGGVGGASAGTSACAGQGTGAVWSALPGGDGLRAAESKAACEAQCQRDGVCGLWDPGECSIPCADPRELCQADVATDACWTALTALTSCQAGLSCFDLDHYYYHADATRPCMAEVDRMAAACLYVEPDPSNDCYGPNFTCASSCTSISPYWVCDGEADCADASDEANCPWLHVAPPEPRCRGAAIIDADDSAGDVAALAGVTCIGTLQVWKSTLSTLQGLESLTEVGQLFIGATLETSADPMGNPALVSLRGLEGLRTVSQITIAENPLLTDLTALRGLTTLTSDLLVVGNGALASLEGLDRISLVGELHVEDNPALTGFDGLRGLTMVDRFVVTGNPLVQNFTGMGGLATIGILGATVSRNAVLGSITELTGLTAIGGDVTIEQNPELPTCNINALLTPLGKTCTCSGNDDAASCP